MGERFTPEGAIAGDVEKQAEAISAADYLKHFEQSSYYEEALKTRIDSLAKQHGRIPNRSKVKAKFPETDDYRQALWRFYNAGNRIHFDSRLYNSGFLTQLERYWQKIREIDTKVRLHQLDRSDFIRLEYERDSSHFAAAQSLTLSKQVRTVSIGRLIVHFLTMDQGLDRPSPGREDLRQESWKEAA